MPAKKRTYGLWLITQALPSKHQKVLGVIETDADGVNNWLEDHGYPRGKVGVNLLPEVEFYTPMGIPVPAFGLLQSKSKVNPKLVRKPKPGAVTKTGLWKPGPGPLAQTYCAGSSRMTNAKERTLGFATCRVCKKRYSYNMNGRVRKHYA